MTVANIGVRRYWPSAIIVEQGKILDFIDSKTQRLETPEEYVRQEIAKSLVREYGYAKADIEVEFILRLGTRKPRADLIIMPPDTDHTQENAHIIVECKASTVKAADERKTRSRTASRSYNAAGQCAIMTCGLTALIVSATVALKTMSAIQGLNSRNSRPARVILLAGVVRRAKPESARVLTATQARNIRGCTFIIASFVAVHMNVAG